MFYSDIGYLLVDTKTGSVDDYNNETVATEEIEVACAFTDKVSRERWLNYADVEEIDAEVRFTLPKPDKSQRFKITQRFGRVVPEKTYEIIGVKDRGTFGYVLALKAVTV